MKELFSLSYYRALLAPMRFGSGIKGKISDSWYYGVPCITTPIGAEGMFLKTYNNNKDYVGIDTNSRFFKSEENTGNEVKDSFDKKFVQYYKYDKTYTEDEFGFGGSYLNYSKEDFIENSVKMYDDKEYWLKNAAMGYKIVENRMSFLINEVILLKKMSEIQSKLQNNRKKNYIQELTWIETLKSFENATKFMNFKVKKKIPGIK